MTDSQVKLILLDFDGTLADTRRAHTLAYAAAFHEAGHELDIEEYETRYFGMRCDEFLTHMGFSDPEERKRLKARKIALYPTFFASVKLNHTLWDFCQVFRAQGGRVWIVSTGSPDNVTNAMRYLGITEGVDGVLTGADITPCKPAPDCFLEAMRREGCTPQQTLIFEDSEVGVEAAKRSGASYFVVKL